MTRGRVRACRLRHAGRVPAILYGGKRAPRALSLDHTKLQLARRTRILLVDHAA